MYSLHLRAERMNQRRISLARFYMHEKRFIQFYPDHPQMLSVSEQIAYLDLIRHNKWRIYNIGDKLKNIFLYDNECVDAIEALFIDITDTQLCSNFVVAPFKAALLSFRLSYACRIRCFANMLRDSGELFVYFYDEIDKLLHEPLYAPFISDFCRFAEVFALVSQDMQYTETTALVFDRIQELFTFYEPTVEYVAYLANYCIYVTRGMQNACIGPGFFRFMLRICETLGTSPRMLQESFACNPCILQQLMLENFASKYIDWWKTRQGAYGAQAQGAYQLRYENYSGYELSYDHHECFGIQCDFCKFFPSLDDCFEWSQTAELK